MKLGITVEKIRYAEFNIWLPDRVKDNVADATGIVVLTGGSNGDSRDWVEDPKWQEFATKHDIVLIGTFFQDKNPTGIEGYCKANEESGAALLWAVTEYQERLKLKGLAHVPLYLFGFSAGGQFNYEMNAAFPERVGAFVVNKGGIYYTALTSELARMTPGLFITGSKDDVWRQDVVKGLVAVNRRGGATWKLVQEHIGHGLGESENISRFFFEGVIKARN